MHTSNRPDDALMVAHMEALAMLLAVREERNHNEGLSRQSKTKHGRKEANVSWEVLIIQVRRAHIQSALGSCEQRAQRVQERLGCQHVSPAVTSHFQISHATSLFSLDLYHMNSTHILVLAAAVRNVFTGKKALTNHQTLSSG